jgi:hypothetical protein
MVETTIIKKMDNGYTISNEKLNLFSDLYKVVNFLLKRYFVNKIFYLTKQTNSGYSIIRS